MVVEESNGGKEGNTKSEGEGWNGDHRENRGCTRRAPGMGGCWYGVRDAHGTPHRGDWGTLIWGEGINGSAYRAGDVGHTVHLVGGKVGMGSPQREGMGG